MTDLTNQVTQKELNLLSKGKLNSMPFDTPKHLALDLIVTMQREKKLREALIYARDLLRETYSCDYEIIDEALRSEYSEVTVNDAKPKA